MALTLVTESIQNQSQTENQTVPLSKTQKFLQLFRKDRGISVERRIKVLTHGIDDTADPCIPVQIPLPDGRTLCALYFSGGRVIHYPTLEELLRGGVRQFHK